MAIRVGNSERDRADWLTGEPLEQLHQQGFGLQASNFQRTAFQDFRSNERQTLAFGSDLQQNYEAL